MSNSKTALRIAEACFGFVAVYYTFLCWLTRYDTVEWLTDDTLYTTWDVRLWIAAVSTFLIIICLLMETVE